MGSEPFRRHAAGEPHGVPVNFDGPNAHEFPAPAGTEDDEDPGTIFVDMADPRAGKPEFQGLAADVLSRLPHDARVRTVDPKLMWGLAAAIAAIIGACAVEKMKAKLTRVKERPDGLLARRITRNVADQLPAEWAGDRVPIANAMVEVGKEAVDDTARWASIEAAR